MDTQKKRCISSQSHTLPKNGNFNTHNVILIQCGVTHGFQTAQMRPQLSVCTYGFFLIKFKLFHGYRARHAPVTLHPRSKVLRKKNNVPVVQYNETTRSRETGQLSTSLQMNGLSMSTAIQEGMSALTLLYVPNSYFIPSLIPRPRMPPVALTADAW